MFIKLAHQYWKEHLLPGDYTIDATAGNGFDTLFLAKLVLPNGGVFAIDIQNQAIRATKARLSAHLTPKEMERVFLYEMSHATFPKEAYNQPIKLIVYNLGYLPGSDKQIKTYSPSTLESLRNALKLLSPGGMISVMCYPGHKEGVDEEAAVVSWAKEIPPNEATICYHTQLNKPTSPRLLIVKKIYTEVNSEFGLFFIK